MSVVTVAVGPGAPVTDDVQDTGVVLSSGDSGALVVGDALTNPTLTSDISLRWFAD